MKKPDSTPSHESHPARPRRRRRLVLAFGILTVLALASFATTSCCRKKAATDVLVERHIMPAGATRDEALAVPESESRDPSSVKPVAIVKSPIKLKDIRGARAGAKAEGNVPVAQRLVIADAKPASAVAAPPVAHELYDVASPDGVPPPAPAADGETLGYERYADFKENEFLDAAKNPLSTFSIDVDTASYANARRYLEQYNRLPPRDSVRLEEFVNYFTYDYPQPAGKEPFAVSCELADCPWKPGHRLLRVALQSREMDTKDVPAGNLVFLIDTSGSMSDEIGLLQKAFRILVDQLRPEDSVSIVTYAGTAGVLLPATKGSDKHRILSAIDSLRAAGSTAGGAGIQTAYRIAKENFRKGGNNRVILATDGDFNVGVQSDAELQKLIESKRDDGIFLTVLGFGYGNYQDAKMKKLADCGNGNYAYVDNLMEAKKVLATEFGGLYTIAKDVKVQIEFNPAKVGAYRLLGYESRLLQAKDFNDDKKDAGELGAGHRVTAFYELVSPGADDAPPATDELLYQQTTAVDSPDLLTLKLRWKEPDADKSTRVDRPIRPEDIFQATPSEDFRFASAVAECALLLRDSAFKGDASYDALIRRAKAAKGKDEEGYRAEFIRLAERAQLLSSDKK